MCVSVCYTFYFFKIRETIQQNQTSFRSIQMISINYTNRIWQTLKLLVKIHLKQL